MASFLRPWSYTGQHKALVEFIIKMGKGGGGGGGHQKLNKKNKKKKKKKKKK
jgi:hypothetical protein